MQISTCNTNLHIFLKLTHENRDLDRILNSMATILDALNPIRNNQSLAHPNRILIKEPEAMLLINTARSLLNYLNLKLS